MCFCIADFDSICHLFDSKPKKVFADSFNPPWSPYKGGAGVHAWIEFESGARCGFLTTFMNQKVSSEPNSPSSIPSQGLRIEFESGTAECGSFFHALRSRTQTDHAFPQHLLS